MLLKPSEVEYVEIQEEFEDSLEDIEGLEGIELEEGSEIQLEKPKRKLQETISDEDDDGVIFGKTILIGGTEEPIFLDDDINLNFQGEEDEYEFEEEFVFGEAITIGGSSQQEAMDEEYMEDEFSSEFDSEFGDDSLYDLDSEFDMGEQDFDMGQEFSGDEFSEEDDWEEKKHSTLIGKVDSQLLDKIKEYRENIHEMSDEKLSILSSDEDRNRLLSEAAMLSDDDFLSSTQDSSTNLIAELDKKINTIIEKCNSEKIQELIEAREQMLKEVEYQVDSVIGEQIEVIKKEAEDHIEETINYYKKKMESENQALSTANNIISRREQILDEAYAKSLTIVEEAEEKAREIIESSSYAQEEAEAIIAEAEQKGEGIRMEGETEAERIISDANVESARIIQAAEDQHQDIVEAATQDGFSVGYQEGKEEAIKENSELLREATNALNKLHAAFPVAVKQNEERLIKIAYQISDKVLGEPVMDRPELCEKTLARVMKQVSDFEPVKIIVNPSDLDILLPKQEYFKAVIPDIQEFLITGDENVPKGGCVINTVAKEAFNISINSQLSILEAVFNEALVDFQE